MSDQPADAFAGAFYVQANVTTGEVFSVPRQGPPVRLTPEQEKTYWDQSNRSPG